MLNAIASCATQAPVQQIAPHPVATAEAATEPAASSTAPFSGSAPAPITSVATVTTATTVDAAISTSTSTVGKIYD